MSKQFKTTLTFYSSSSVPARVVGYSGGGSKFVAIIIGSDLIENEYCIDPSSARALAQALTDAANYAEQTEGGK